MGCAPSHPKRIESKVASDASINGGGARQPLKRTDSGRSNSSSLRRPPQRKTSMTAATPNNGFHRNGHESVLFPTSDSRWTHLWETHKDLLLDPADMHSAMESCMSNITNKLSVTEITFLQRKVRSIVRQSTNNPEKAARMTNILRTSNPTMSHEQEAKAIAERYHLLSNHVVKKVLPKLPSPAGAALQETNDTINGGASTIADNVFLLGIFLHESLWDRVANIASSTALEAGAEMDANNYKLPEETPNPVTPVTAEAPEIPPGMSLHALAFIIALALRGSRVQKLQLLFYILLPPMLLHEFLEEHPAGGPPLWLLEVGSDILLSMASLSHYYYYSDTFTPSTSAAAHTSKQTELLTPPLHSRLMINGPNLISLIKTILVPPQQLGAVGTRTPNGTLVETPTNGNRSPLASPAKKSTKMRRRASHQALDEEVTILPPTTEVMDQLTEPFFNLDDYVEDDLTLRDTLLNALRELEGKESVSMSEFMDFCQRALDDDALSALMHRFFGYSVFPSPTLELELVTSRWKEWQETECVLYNKATEEPEGALEILTQSVRKILLLQKDESIEASAERVAINKPFGGIGGFDGLGGLGYGVMYCIDKDWWTSWESYVGWSWAGESNSYDTTKRKRTRLRPGGVSSEPLLDRFDDDIIAGTMGSYELMKTGLEKDQDYVLVPASVWDILYELYGGGPPLPRMVIPPASQKASNGMGHMSCMPSSHEESDLRALPSETQLDSMASTDNADRVLRLPQQLQVLTHPWVFHIHLCDPQQPYRRGDTGPLTIRVMAAPDQPLWRLYAETVVRLPFHLYRAYGNDGRGKARLWKRVEATGPKNTSSFGPWSLLCKNRHAILPKRGIDGDLEHRLAELTEDWKTYADNASVESIGLVDGDQLMVECAVVNRNGEFMWPREAAAKAGHAKRLEDKALKFRRLLRGLDDNGKPLPNPQDLVGMRVDAMDASGKWFQVEISQVQIVAADTDDEEDSMEMAHVEVGKGTGESKQVLVDFVEHGGHSEWIDIESDRLAPAGRFTLDAVDEPLESAPKPTISSLPGNNIEKPKSQPQVKKASEQAEANGKLCTIPGYGACGLANLGNTCYANSAIQCVSYLPLLRAYLVSLQYKATGDLNRDNPLGTEGKLLEEFADLLRQMWSAKIGEKSPTRFRAALGKANELFQGADQQDSQEFLSFILDILHEDSNRVRKKPQVEGLDDEWKKKTSLPRVGEEEWRRFLRRNRSIMADICMGQVLNTVTCPVCNFSSRSFDPFNLLSLPFPTVADVIFKCFVVRRANAYNTPWVLNKPKKGSKARTRFIRRDLSHDPKPPSIQLVVEEYIIPMSRLADSGDLKLQIQNLTGIPASALSVCRGDTSFIKDKKDDAVVRSHCQATMLTDKEGPCSQLASRQRANSEDFGAAQSAPSLIVAFESTLRTRPQEPTKEEESSDSNTEEEEEEEGPRTWELNKKEMKELEKQIDQYGNLDECRLYDTDTLLIAKALSRSLWPQTEDDLKLGLRVDAIDHKEHWFPGSVIEIIESPPATNGAEANTPPGPKIKVRIHFDNFSSRWDEIYSIEHFNEGRVRPLYSHAAPRARPTEFVVHHRFTDRTTHLSNLFGQSFYVQCHSEWTAARAGAQILAQASRFLKLPAEFEGGAIDETSREREVKVQRLYDRTQAVISDLIDLLIESDRQYVHCALGVSPDSQAQSTKEVQRFRNPGFDASNLSQNLSKKVATLQQRLPFEVRVCTVDSTLGGTNDELSFPFSLMRTIGNYMSARHVIVLQWREPPSDKKTPNGRPWNYLGAPVMYVAPPVVVDTGSADILNTATQRAKLNPSSRGSGGLPLGVCLTEYCKLQQLPTWRCPKCNDFRDGKQNMALWRLPDLLTIHLKRFNCSARWREKITTKVNFPLTGLDLQEWCHLESPVLHEGNAGESCVYDLVGVLNHYGGMTGGHYVATCKASACSKDGREEVAYDFNSAGSSKPIFLGGELDPDSQSVWKFGRQRSEVNQKKITAALTARAAAESAEPLWLQFDDDLVEPIPPRFVVSETAYVLFYRRRHITASNIAKYSTLE